MSSIPPPGSWQMQDSPIPIIGTSPTFLESHKGRIILLTTLAVAAITTLIAGGVVYSFTAKELTSYILAGSGGSIILADITTLAILYIRFSRPVTKGSYNVVSWNIEYEDLFAADVENEDSSSTETGDKRIDHQKLSRAFLEQSDIICLQKTPQLDSSFLMRYLPGYSSYSFVQEGNSSCTILWKTSKFSMIGSANLEHNPDWDLEGKSKPGSMVLLQDQSNGTKLCVTSSYLPNGTNTANGKSQIRYYLDAMKIAPQADLFLYAIDSPDFEEQTNLIEKSKYQRDKKDSAPTFRRLSEDSEAVSEKHNYIFAKSRSGARALIQKVDLPSHIDLGRSLEHALIMNQIIFKA